LFVAQKVFLIMIFKCEAGRSTCGGKAKLVDDLFPEFVVRYGLPSAFFADGFVEFEKVEFLTTNLRDFDLGYAFGTPIFGKVFLEFALLF
jgi:hypothetical protein